MIAAAVPTPEALDLVADELAAVAGSVATDGADDLERLADAIGAAGRVFVLGAGRSGLALRMTAMRLMHLGLIVYVVGEPTTPAIGPGDVLLTASGSGTTGGIVRAARSARDAGADVVAITAAAHSPLAELSAVRVIVPAAGKLDRSDALSAQYAGSLFEQAVVIVGDAVFHTLWSRSAATADDLWLRHANLE